MEGERIRVDARGEDQAGCKEGGSGWMQGEKIKVRGLDARGEDQSGCKGRGSGWMQGERIKVNAMGEDWMQEERIRLDARREDWSGCWGDDQIGCREED